MVFTFWILAFLVFYAYFGYPIVLLLVSNLGKYQSNNRLIRKTNNYNLPNVDLLIAAYNEEKVIGLKLVNSLETDYPQDKLNIYVVSDGSTDNTNDIVKEFSKKYKNVNLISVARIGKSAAINTAIKFLKGEIVVFSDANTEYEKGAIRRIVDNFKIQNVGCVCGRLIYRNPGQIISGVGESFYWRFETFLKKLESKIGFIAGANGAIYAIKRKLFVPFPETTINDDFTLSMRIVENGFKSLYDELAIGYEDVAPSMESEFKRHVRDGAGHYIAITHLTKLLNPFLGIRSFIYVSHRILRWIIPFVLLVLLYVNYNLLETQFYRLFFYGQICFYAISILGWLLSKHTKLPFIVYVPFYFCNLNAALFLGFFKAIFGLQKTKWSSTMRTQSS